MPLGVADELNQPRAFYRHIVESERHLDDRVRAFDAEKVVPQASVLRRLSIWLKKLAVSA